MFYPKHTSFDLIGYRDVNFTRSKVECKNTSGTCQYLGHLLFLGLAKKQNCVVLSIMKEEYIVAGLCCAQLLWMTQTLNDFELSFDTAYILCDNTSAKILFFISE